MNVGISYANKVLSPLGLCIQADAWLTLSVWQVTRKKSWSLWDLHSHLLKATSSLNVGFILPKVCNLTEMNTRTCSCIWEKRPESRSIERLFYFMICAEVEVGKMCMHENIQYFRLCKQSIFQLMFFMV